MNYSFCSLVLFFCRCVVVIIIIIIIIIKITISSIVIGIANVTTNFAFCKTTDFS